MEGSTAQAAALIMRMGDPLDMEQSSSGDQEHDSGPLPQQQHYQEESATSDKEMEDGKIQPEGYEHGLCDDSFACDRGSLDLNRGQGSQFGVSLASTDELNFSQPGESREGLGQQNRRIPLGEPTRIPKSTKALPADTS